MNSPPLISAIVLNYRSPKDTVRCVRALRGQVRFSPFDSVQDDTKNVPVPFPLEILVIDNHSEDDSIGTIRARFRGVPSVRIFETPKNRGYGGGNAIAIRQAQGTYLLITNPDNELPPDGLARMVAVMESDPSIGILAPKLVHEDGSVRDSVRRFPRIIDILAKRSALKHVAPGALERYLDARSSGTTPRDVDWAVGACLLIRRDLYEKLGGFDQRYFLFFEDIDLCRRCWAAGKRVVYMPEITVRDRKRRLSEGGMFSILLRRVGRVHIASAMKYFWKWRGTALPR